MCDALEDAVADVAECVAGDGVDVEGDKGEEDDGERGGKKYLVFHEVL